MLKRYSLFNLENITFCMFFSNWLTETMSPIIYLSRPFKRAWFSKYIMHYYVLDQRTIGVFSSICAISNNAGKILTVLPMSYTVNVKSYLGVVTTQTQKKTVISFKQPL